MPKICDEALARYQVRLFKNDIARLQKYYGADNQVNAAIRAFVHRALNQIEKKAAEELNPPEPIEE